MILEGCIHRALAAWSLVLEEWGCVVNAGIVFIYFVCFPCTCNPIRNACLVQLTFSLAWLYFFYLFLFFRKKEKKTHECSRTDAKLSKDKHITVCMYKHIQYIWCFILTASAVFAFWTASTRSFIGFPLQYQSAQASDIISLTVMWMRLHVIMSNSKCWGTQFDQV